MIWLWISLGIIGGLIILVIIMSIVVFHLAINRYSLWNTDKNKVIFSFPEPYQSQALAYFDWFHNSGEIVSIKSFDGLTLKAKYFAHPSAKRTVIMAHGYRGKPDYDFSLSHHWFYEQECNVLVIYQRAHGLSEGKYITMGIYEREDIHSWEEYIESLDNLPIYLIGISMGTASILMSFYKPYSNRVKGIVADCGYYSIHRQFVDEVGKFVSKPVARFFLFFANWWCVIFAKFSMKQVDTRKIVKNINLPILFVHGDKDSFVKPYQSQRNYEACGSKEKVLIIAHGADHGKSLLFEEDKYKEEIKRIFLHDNDK